MDVIIVSKTHMSSASCVGGVLGNGKFVRLLDSYGHNQAIDTTLKIGDVYTITYTERNPKTPPHVEDILLSSIKFKFSFASVDRMVTYLKEKLNVKIWKGSPDVLFDGLLQWTDNGSGYISENNSVPSNSVGFWIPDRQLTKRVFYEKIRYNYPKPSHWRSLPYVGFDDPIEVIPSGTLVRVSLARWWDTNGSTEDRCSLQLSGWYITKPTADKKVEMGDLPF